MAFYSKVNQAQFSPATATAVPTTVVRLTCHSFWSSLALIQRTDLIALKKEFFFRLDFYRMTVVGGLFRLRSINRLTTTSQQRYSIKNNKLVNHTEFFGYKC